MDTINTNAGTRRRTCGWESLNPVQGTLKCLLESVDIPNGDEKNLGGRLSLFNGKRRRVCRNMVIWELYIDCTFWSSVSRVDMHSGKPRWNNWAYLEELVRVKMNVLKAQTAEPPGGMDGLWCEYQFSNMQEVRRESHAQEFCVYCFVVFMIWAIYVLFGEVFTLWSTVPLQSCSLDFLRMKVEAGLGEKQRMVLL